ncbi:unnamed protein product, partial [Prorocentrum cordatum]
VAHVMSRLWTFSTWSTSRWCRAGECCRALLGSLFVGLSDYITKFLLTSVGLGDYYMGSKI